MGTRKKWWLLPIIVVLLVFGGLLILAQGSAVAPFIYTVFWEPRPRSMRLLGISAFYHDSAAALVDDGQIIAAAQEERFTRRKHDADFPVHAIQYCLDAAKVDLDDIDHIVFYEKPLIKFERLVETYLDNAPHGFQSFRMEMTLWINEQLINIL